jgi:hypothetical protein
MTPPSSLENLEDENLEVAAFVPNSDNFPLKMVLV